MLNNCLVIVIVYGKDINRGVTKKRNCCCLHQVVNSEAQKCRNNKEFEIKLNTNLFLFYLQTTSSYIKRFEKVKKILLLCHVITAKKKDSEKITKPSL